MIGHGSGIQREVRVRGTDLPSIVERFMVAKPVQVRKEAASVDDIWSGGVSEQRRVDRSTHLPMSRSASENFGDGFASHVG